MNHVDPTITHISLCTGYGGLDLGIRRVVGERLRTIAYSEIEAFACELLLSRMEGGQLDSAPIWPDLRTFPWEEFTGVSVISGGFPCQPFSAAGSRAGDEDPRHLFPFILDGIRRARPTAVFLENVEGIVSAKLKGNGWSDPAGTPVLLHVLRELERVGYVAEAGLFSASVDAGAPHQRKRVFILAHRLGEGLEGWLPRGPHPQREALDGHAGCGSPSVSSGREDVADSRSQRRQQVAASTPRDEEADRRAGRDVQQPDGDHLAQCLGESHAWPARPGESQHDWEPPRVLMGDTERGGRQSWDGGQQIAEVPRAGCDEGGGRLPTQGQAQPSLCGSLDGTASRLAYAELCSSCDSRWDELRLAGNGVVAQCAAVAFHELACRLNNKPVTP